MKFLTDSTLGKLTKWLRILGFDTVNFPGNLDEYLVNQANAQDRLVLTRSRNFSHKEYRGRLLIIKHDKLAGQLAEIIERLSLDCDKDRFFTRCPKCNESLENVAREDIYGLVPDYVRDNNARFHICHSCRRVYWPGTHRANMESFIRSRIPFHLL